MNYERDIETVENIALSLRPRSQSDIIQEQSKNNYVKDFLDNKVCLIEDILDYFPEEATLLNANIDIKIDGQKAKCFEYYVKRDNTVSGKNVELEMYSITYNIIYKQYLILLQGMVNKNSVVNFDAKSTFEQYKPLFQLMANSLVITSK
jgi:superfamily II DNA helicase RecQ